MTYTEHSSLFTVTTTPPISATDETQERTFMADLGTDLGAPFELYIKHTSSVGSTGILKYTDGNAGAPADGQISADESKEIGNNVHRILKYYLGANYVVNNISQVRLNVVFRT